MLPPILPHPKHQPNSPTTNEPRLQHPQSSSSLVPLLGVLFEDDVSLFTDDDVPRLTDDGLTALEDDGRPKLFWMAWNCSWKNWLVPKVLAWLKPPRLAVPPLKELIEVTLVPPPNLLPRLVPAPPTENPGVPAKLD